MSESSRVAWTEGLFLQPQHFQQTERFVEKLVGATGDSTFAYRYGFVQLDIDQELGQLGKLGLARARGIFPDGTPFDIPYSDDIPAPLEVPDGAKDATVVLALPLRRPNMPSISLKRGADNALARYYTADTQARDAVADWDSSADLKIGKLNLSLRLADGLSPAYCALGVVRVSEKRADGRLILDDDEYYPPVMDCRASPKLLDCVNEVHGRLRQTAQALAERLGQAGTKGVAEFIDFLLLQLCNRSQPVYAHLAVRAVLHPEVFYFHLLALAGELGTFRKDRRAPEFQPYRHDALWETFHPVMEEVRRGLTALPDAAAVSIPVEKTRRAGYFVGRVQDVVLLRTAIFVLAVNAQMPADALVARFPREAQIGSRERIQTLVELQLPGIVLRPLPVVPREIPYHGGYTYFELEKSRRPNDPVDYWKDLEGSRMLVMHVAGDFPELVLELWAIRRD